MSYARFSLMILTSTLVMFVLMYLNTYAWEHLYFSETRAYMAVLMGSAMAFIMLAFMWGMYSRTGLNVAILAVSLALFGLSLWLVRSQVTVSGESYLRAMIPHHSIAILTSERAGIIDPRVQKLAQEIAAVQRREIAEMRYQMAHIRPSTEVYEDPPPRAGSVDDAFNNTLVSLFDLAPVSRQEASMTTEPGGACGFRYGPESDPVLWVSRQYGSAAAKLNGVLISLDEVSPTDSPGRQFMSSGAAVSVRSLSAEEADWRQDAELVLTLKQGMTVGYRGFWSCDG